MNYFNTSLFVTCGLLLSVQCFLMNTNKPPSSIVSLGNDSIAYFDQRMNHLQTQIQLQNNTLKTQAIMIEQLLNISKQTPSTQTLSNELSVLQVYVQRIMGEYHRLSNISDATDLALKINNMANSIKFLSVSLNRQEQKDTDISQELASLKATILSEMHQATSRITSLEYSLSSVNQSVASLSALERQNENQLTSISNDLQTTKSRLSSLQGTMAHVSSQISTLTNQYSDIASKVSTLSSDLHSTRSTLSTLQTTVSHNQQYSSSHISSLTNQYSALSTSLQKIQDRTTTLEHNLEQVLIRGVRLSGGSISGEGRLEVNYMGKWGTVCDDAFTDKSAQVVCHQLGYNTHHSTYKESAAYGQGSGSIVLDDVSCEGDERSVALCRHYGFEQNNCQHSEDVGVVCFDIRLVGGSTSREGRVEVKVGGTWGTVCDNYWDDNDARVVCRMLGYSGTATAYSSAHFGQGSGRILMDNVKCTGTEKSLALCPFSGFGHENCGHNEDASVICH
ncbi:deleted in malignant brain tumors 1 protein-like [Saccostrea echinata]|uniref:deleted in malignant brain tumors 1 protein-like n=1 Tax=Saccostrea echinata TaxID=191078 RepID=UPI002A81C22E|nr:deleted in malignant brain tumors 1 protein-like [Saccostrea echinata]